MWKIYIAAGIAGIGLIISAIFWYNKQLEKVREETREKIELQYKLDLEQANARASQLETSLANTKKELAMALNAKNTEVTDQAVRTETVIKTIIQEKPIYRECKVDAEVLDELNALRRVGNE